MSRLDGDSRSAGSIRQYRDERALRRVVKQPRPLIAGKVQVKPLERSETTNGDWDLPRHAGHDSRVDKDPPAGHRADVDQLGPFIASAAPTEPQVTNVTSASTARIAVGDDEGITAGMLLEPAPRPIVEYDIELVHDEIMALPAWLGGRDVLVVAEDVLRVVLASRPCR